MEINLNDIISKVIKYMVEGLAVATAAYYIPQKTMKPEEIAIIAVTAASSFAVLDLIAPSIGNSARHGAGMTIGSNMVGGPSGVPFA